MPEPQQEIEDPTTIPPPEAPPPPATTVTPPAANGDPDAGKTVQLRHSDFKKIKDEAKEKGRREALDSLDSAAVQAGFTSAADAFKALGDLKKQPPAQSQTATQQPQETTVTQQPKPPKPVTVDRAAIEAARVAEANKKARKQWREDQRRARNLEREKASLEVEMNLRGELYGMGVKDVEFGVHLLRMEMRRISAAAQAAGGNPEAELAKFDRKVFMDGVRKDRPYLFGETVVPATTGTNGTSAAAGTPAPPPAGQPTVTNAQDMTFDARKATPEQVREKILSMGLNPNL